MFPEDHPVDSNSPVYRPKDPWAANWSCDGAADRNSFWLAVSGVCSEATAIAATVWEDIIETKYLCTVPECLTPGSKIVSFKADRRDVTIELNITVELPDEPPEDEFSVQPRREITIHEITLNIQSLVHAAE